MNKIFTYLVIILTTSYIVLTLVNNRIIVIDTPTTSEVVEGDDPVVKKKFYESGKLLSETPYENGKAEGLVTVWYESGGKEYESYYKNGKKEGLRTRWYESGEKEGEIYFKNDEPTGLSTSWYQYGEKMTETSHKNGKPEGLRTWWFPSGNKMRETPFKNGKEDGLETIWYQSGKKKSEKHYEIGIEIGIRKEWDKDGKLTYERNYIDGVEEIQDGVDAHKRKDYKESVENNQFKSFLEESKDGLDYLKIEKENKPNIHRIYDEKRDPNPSTFRGAKGYPDKNNNINIKYTNNINGMKVDVIWEPFDSIGGYVVGEATIRFTDPKAGTGFSVYISNFGVVKSKTKSLNLEWDDELIRFKFDKKTIHIDNKESDQSEWCAKCDIFFYDLDFDNNKELVFFLPGLGNRGMGIYKVYAIKDGNLVDSIEQITEEEPYSELNGRTTVDSTNRTIKIHGSSGVCNSVDKVYRFNPTQSKERGKYILEKYFQTDIHENSCHLFEYNVDQDRNLSLVSKKNLES